MIQQLLRLFVWFKSHPEIYVPVLLAVLNTAWRSQTNFGHVLRRLGPDPLGAWRAFRGGPVGVPWDAPGAKNGDVLKGGGSV